MKRYWEIIADKLSKAGWTWGCLSEPDSAGRVIFTADAYAHVFEIGIGDSARAAGWPTPLGQMTRVRSRSSRKLCACVISRSSSGVR